MYRMRAISLKVYSFEGNKGRSYCIGYHYLIDQLGTAMNGFTFLVRLQIYRHWRDVTDYLIKADDTESYPIVQ
jgi:hypothetical protein